MYAKHSHKQYPYNEIWFLFLSFLLFPDPDILNGVYMSEALNDVFVSNFQKDPTLTWQYFGSSTGFFRLYPGLFRLYSRFGIIYVFLLRPSLKWQTTSLLSFRNKMDPRFKWRRLFRLQKQKLVRDAWYITVRRSAFSCLTFSSNSCSFHFA